MEHTVLKVEDEENQLKETIRYWQSRPDYERMEAVANIVREAYTLKGIDINAGISPKTITRVPHPKLKLSGKNQ